LAAKQMLLGERPLRDFADGGLQGAWPALTYELPALAQRLFGANLLSEALFCVGTIALSTALLFRSAAAIAGIGPGLTVALLSLASSTRLYGYSKVLVSAGAVVLLLRYAKRPSWATVGWLALWSTCGFLFRHDYLVYTGAATAFLILTLPGVALRRRLAHVLAYGGLTLALLAGPLYSVHHFVGLGQYLRTNLELTRRESRRTDLEWPTFEASPGSAWSFFDSEVNATAALYYLCLALPVVAFLASLGRARVPGLDDGRSRALLWCLMLYAALLNAFLLRGNLSARFGDLGTPIAVIAAWLLSLPARGVTRAAAAALLIPVALAVNTTGSVWQELATTGFRVSPVDVWHRAAEVADGLRGMPPPADATPEERTRTRRSMPTVIDYLRACTRPTDRLLTLADAPEVAVFAGRAFAAGQPTFRAGFYTLDEDEALMLARMARQSIPVVLTKDQQDYDQHVEPDFRSIHAYVAARYVPVGELPALTGGPMRVLVRRDVLRSEPFADTGIPCPY
jgi:hypothetical protein